MSALLSHASTVIIESEGKYYNVNQKMRFKDMVVGILKKNGDRIQPEMAPFNPAD